MIRKWLLMVAGWLVVSVVVCAVAPAAGAIPQEKPQDKPPAYTLPEYNAYQAAAKEPNPQQRIRLLDDFVAKYPSSTLLVYAYQTYYTTYNELKNYPKTIEYADRLLTFGDKLDAGTQLQALYIRTLAFNYSFNEKAADAKEQATRARGAESARGPEKARGRVRRSVCTEQERPYGAVQLHGGPRLAAVEGV